MASIKNKYTLVCGDDWQGLYKNGELVLENHRLDLKDAFNEVVSSGGISEFSSVNCDYDWLDDLGTLPKSLSEVKIIDD